MLRRSGHGLLGKPVCEQGGLERCGVALPGADYSWEQFLADCQTIRSKGLTPIACSLIEMPHYWFEFAVLNRGGVDAHLQLP